MLGYIEVLDDDSLSSDDDRDDNAVRSGTWVANSNILSHMVSNGLSAYWLINKQIKV